MRTHGWSYPVQRPCDWLIMRAHNVFDPKYRAIIELAVASMTICKNGFTHSFPRQQRRRARFKEIKHRLGICLFCICGVWPIEGFFIARGSDKGLVGKK